MIPEQQTETRTPTIDGTFDGSGAGDNDQPYRFGRKPTVSQPFPFSTDEFARLLILRSRIDTVAAFRHDRRVTDTRSRRNLWLLPA